MEPSINKSGERPRVIEFYKANGAYGAFSNFSRHPITLKGKEWPTSEHYYQAQKFAGTHHEEEIRLMSKPMAAAEAGRSRARPRRADWEEVKEGVMKDVLVAKFTQHKSLGKLLLSTGEAVLVEASNVDYYWGRGADGSGKNRLGYLLMVVRKELAKDSDQENDNDEPINAIVTPSQVNLKASKRKKLRSRVNAFVDADGSSKVERSAKGGVEVLCSDSTRVQMSASVLPAAGHLAIYRGKKQTALPQRTKAALFDEEEESEEEEQEVASRQTPSTFGDFFISAPTALRPHTLKMSTSPPSAPSKFSISELSTNVDTALSTISKLAELRKSHAPDSSIAPLLSSLSDTKRKLCSVMENCSALNDSSVDEILSTVDAINKAMLPSGQELVL